MSILQAKEKTSEIAKIIILKNPKGDDLFKRYTNILGENYNENTPLGLSQKP